jgi:Zn-dependent M16 (insulinase) family peptidase
MTANDSRDLLETLAMKVVSGYLLDNSASPLRKALIDSKLGDDLGSSGYADWQRDTYFCLVLKGSEPGNAAAMEELCLSVLSQECERGFDREKVNSVLRQIELLARERRPQYPLRLMERVFSGWLYDSDPIQQLRLSERLEELRNNIDHQPGYLEAITRRYLLENPHRLRVTLVPDLELAASREKADQEAMASRLERLAPEEMQAIRDTASRLETMQSEGNTPEALATLPRLCLADVSPHPLELAYEQERAGNFDLLDVKVASGGVAYLHLSLDLEGLPDDIIDYLPLFSEALGKGGAGGLDYAAMAEREAAATGALDFSAGMAGHINGPDKARLRFSIWMKALESEWTAALAVLGDRLFRPDFQDQERLRDIILQDRMGWRNQIVPSGNAYAALFAGRLLSRPLAISERLGGCSQARRIDHLADTVETALSELPNRFTTIQQEILARAVPSASLVGSPAVKAATRAWLADNSRLFSLSSPAALSPPVVAAPVPRRVALAAPTDVNYAARVLPAPPLDSPDAPALILLGLQWSYGYLWNEIRVKGGAYGARAAYDGVNGVFQFSSYRDPAINRTLAAFAGLEKFAAEVMDLSPAGLEQAIIGTVKTLDQPIRPSAAATLALSRHLGGESAAFRQKFRDRLLGLGADEVRQAAARVFTGLAEAPICVIGSRERINQENLAGDSFHLHLESLWEADPSLDKAASALNPDID